MARVESGLYVAQDALIDRGVPSATTMYLEEIGKVKLSHESEERALGF